MTMNLTTAARRAVRLWTVVAVLTAAIISVIVTHLILTSFAGGWGLMELVLAASIPVLIGAPVVLHLAVKHHQLTAANRRLLALASTDSLTSILNRRAFTSLADDYLAGGPPVSTAPEGAFLVIDADDFKSINDLHGHDRGDEALQRIASTIKVNVREDDLVGRIGGEEFGVLLVGADFATAKMVAERIRHAITAIAFEPGGTEHRLSVSVGGAAFDQIVAFGTLYRFADQRLYEAKRSGRNRVHLAPVDIGEASKAA